LIRAGATMVNDQREKMICTRCPKACQMHVVAKADGRIEINGSECDLGEEYARDEAAKPAGIITSTVRVKSGVYPKARVWTTGPVPENRVGDLIKELRKFNVSAPLRSRQVLIKNILELGIDIESRAEVPVREIKLKQKSKTEKFSPISKVTNVLSDSFQRRMSERIDRCVKEADTTKKVIIGSQVIQQTASCFKELFGDKAAVIVADKNTYLAAGKAAMSAFVSSGKKDIRKSLIIEDNDLYAEYGFVKRITGYLNSLDAIPVAVGSGTINDLVKLSAHNCRLPYMIIATAGSMDGYTAFGASVTKEGFKQTLSCAAPAAVIADIDIIEKAPEGMNSSGYADLIAKIPAGADWIMADALGIDEIDARVWSLIQPYLREWTSIPSGINNRDKKAIMMLMEGLVMSGLAMQAAQSSRPASGAEHQFSHLWDNEHHTHNGSAPAHGFKVGIGSICSESVYDNLLKTEEKDIITDYEIINMRWPQWKAVEAMITGYFREAVLARQVIQQSSTKYIDAKKLSERMRLLRSKWPQIKLRLQEQLLGAKKIQEMIKAAGAPSQPIDIGIDYARLHSSFRYAQLIRKRYTVLDAVLEAGLWNRCVDSLFSRNGFWETMRSDPSHVRVKDLEAVPQKAMYEQTTYQKY
jgi:glycerol-1-phosphate dehydrogenase [NAD(P)+]